MNDAKTADSKRAPATGRRANFTMLPLIGYGYLVAFLFLAIFLVSLAKATKLSASLSSPRWPLLIAVILVLPLLLPAFKYVAPYIKTIKISDFEVSFMQAEVASYSLATLTGQLRTPTEQVSAPEFANMMAVSYSRFIIDTIKAVRLTKDEVLVVDLGTGTAWIPPNLYFLSLLVADRTSVRQIVFVETRHLEGVFVGMCFPGELQQALGQKFPVLQKAAEQSKSQQLPLDYVVGSAYFEALRDLYAKIAPSLSSRDSWLNSGTLFALTGSSIQRQKIESKESLTEADYRQILRSDYPYTAVVRDEHLESLISRDRVALLVARNLATM
jgi:hypothetical protein